MPPFLVDLAAALMLEMVKSAGHELGVLAVARLGPHLTAEEAGRIWSAFVKRCEQTVATNPVTPADLQHFMEVEGEVYPVATVVPNDTPGGEP